MRNRRPRIAHLVDPGISKRLQNLLKREVKNQIASFDARFAPKIKDNEAPAIVPNRCTHLIVARCKDNSEKFR